MSTTEVAPEKAVAVTRPLEDAYQAIRAHLHGRDASAEAREELRSVLWLTAEAVEKFGQSGRDLRVLGDTIAGVETRAELLELFSRPVSA